MPFDDKMHEDREKTIKERLKGSIWSKLTEVRGQDLKIRSVSNIGPADY